MAANYLIPYSVIILSVLVLLVFLTKPKTYLKANRYLAISISIFCLFFLYNFLLRLQVYFYAPHLYRAFVPIYLLVGPFSFFYVRSVLTDRARLQTRDALHFLPCLLIAVEMLPFYLESAAQKTARMTLYFSTPYGDAQPEGLLTTQQHNVVLALSMVVYGVASWRMVQHFVRRHPSATDGPFGRWFQWIKLYCLFMILPLSVSTILIVVSFAVAIPHLHTLNYFLLCIFFAIVLVALFLYPSVLYGLPKVEPAADQASPSDIPTTDVVALPMPPAEAKRAGITEEKIKKIAEEIDHYLLQEQPFLKQGFSLSDLATRLRYSVHLVSAVINQHYQMRFTDLINRHRVRYVIQNCKNKAWQNLTLEAIAAEAGFSTRATFISAFKKDTGQTPSHFFASVFTKDG